MKNQLTAKCPFCNRQVAVSEDKATGHTFYNQHAGIGGQECINSLEWVE